MEESRRVMQCRLLHCALVLLTSLCASRAKAGSDQLLFSTIPDHPTACTDLHGWCLGQRSDLGEPPKLRGQAFRATRALRLTVAVFEVARGRDVTWGPTYDGDAIQLTAWLYRTTDSSSNFTVANAELVAASSPASAQLMASALSGSSRIQAAFAFDDSDPAWILDAGEYYFLGISSNDTAYCSVVMPVEVPTGDDEPGCRFPTGSECRDPLADCLGTVVRATDASDDSAFWGLYEQQILHVGIYGVPAADPAAVGMLPRDPSGGPQGVPLSEAIPAQVNNCTHSGGWCLGQPSGRTQTPKLRGMAFRAMRETHLTRAVFKLVHGATGSTPAGARTNATITTSGASFTLRLTAWLYRTSDGRSNFTASNALLVASTGGRSVALASGDWNDPGTSVSFEFDPLDPAWILNSGGYYFLGISSDDTNLCNALMLVGPAAGTKVGCGATYPDAGAYCRPPLAECVGTVTRFASSNASRMQWGADPGHVLYIDVYGSYAALHPTPSPAPSEAPTAALPQGNALPLSVSIPRLADGLGDCPYASAWCLGQAAESTSQPALIGQAFRVARPVRLTKAVFEVVLDMSKSSSAAGGGGVGAATAFQFIAWLFRSADGSIDLSDENMALVVSAPPQYAPLPAASSAAGDSWGQPGIMVTFEFDASNPAWILNQGSYYFLGISSNDTEECKGVLMPLGPAGNDSGCSAYPDASAYCRPPLGECAGAVTRFSGDDYSGPYWAADDEQLLHMDLYGALYTGAGEGATPGP